ncbi:MAG: FHA domain-containing protein, partial [Gammaproteobacteria bacterium]|nr:FHA domain-containing protein [Gammaproteobacteria bacterium]
MAKLIVKLGDKVIREISLVKPETTIGRNIENDIQIDNLAVSNFHARIVKEGEQFFVQDLGSLNGTYLSGKKIELSELNFGDEVSIAKHTLIFEQDDIPFPASGSRQAASSLNLDQTMVLDTRQHRQMEGRTTRPMTSSGQVG